MIGRYSPGSRRNSGLRSLQVLPFPPLGSDPQAFFGQVAQGCDILVFRLPEVPIAYPRGYVALAAWETREIVRAAGQSNPKCWVYAEVDAKRPGLKDAVRGIIAGTRAAGGGGTLHGLALYDYDSAGDEEWKEWDAYWLGG